MKTRALAAVAAALLITISACMDQGQAGAAACFREFSQVYGGAVLLPPGLPGVRQFFARRCIVADQRRRRRLGAGEALKQFLGFPNLRPRQLR